MLFIILLFIVLMLVKMIVELNMVCESGLYILVEFIGNFIIVMFIVVFVVYYVLGICQYMSMGMMFIYMENGFGFIVNILLIIGVGGVFNVILKSSSFVDMLVVIFFNMYMYLIFLVWLVVFILYVVVGFVIVVMMGVMVIVVFMLLLYFDISLEIIVIVIGLGVIGCIIVMDLFFWLVK